jgi:hypothetical protein
LFALALQLVFSFGHVHVEAPTPAVEVSAPAHAADAPGPPPQPEHPEGESDRHFCVLCRLIHLANAWVPPELASLPLPMMVSPVRLTIVVDRHQAAPRRWHFRARAPPLA